MTSKTNKNSGQEYPRLHGQTDYDFQNAHTPPKNNTKLLFIHTPTTHVNCTYNPENNAKLEAV